jgi:hypothetical protein
MGLVDHTVGARQIFTHAVRIAVPEPNANANAHASGGHGNGNASAAAAHQGGDDAKENEPAAAAAAAATGVRVSWYFRSMKNDIKFGVEFRPADAPNVRRAQINAFGFLCVACPMRVFARVAFLMRIYGVNHFKNADFIADLEYIFLHQGAPAEVIEAIRKVDCSTQAVTVRLEHQNTQGTRLRMPQPTLPSRICPLAKLCLSSVSCLPRGLSVV